jgi:pyruvate,water dikinase
MSDRLLLRSTDPADLLQMGGKAAALASLVETGCNVPRFVVLTPAAFRQSLDHRQVEALDAGRLDFDQVRPDPALLQQIVIESADWGPGVAVRSSGVDEDGLGHTFAGQFESYLFVERDDLAQRIVQVWASGFGERVRAYRDHHGLGPAEAPAVLIQQMVDADVAGVAFSADPVTGRRSVAVVSAVHGLGTALVGGDADADTFRVGVSGEILERTMAVKSHLHRADPASATGVVEVDNEAEKIEAWTLSSGQAREVAHLARQAAGHFKRPQDIEWALKDGELFLLQSRPITALSQMPDPDGIRHLWDNSNIVESYSGVTTPLTFTFALNAYEGVYREFCRILGVPASRIGEHELTFARMLGLIRGRVYYNLLNWYRMLSLLPGFNVNREFMEGMMGVREGLPDEIAVELAGRSRGWFRERIDLVRSVFGLGLNHFLLQRRIREFYGRLEEALAPPEVPLEEMRLDELVQDYRRLEASLLTRWDAPLLNDFFAMIHFGVLGRLTAKWCGDENGTLQNDLVSQQGGMISAEPARRVLEMAAVARGGGEELCTLLREAPLARARAAMQKVGDLERGYQDYLGKFGDRCLDELKLESSTLRDDPTPLVRAIGNTAEMDSAGRVRPEGPTAVEAAESRVRESLAHNAGRRVVFGWVLRHARDRVRDRENLRFERTRLFGRVRRIFVEAGRRLWSEGRLDDARDVFYLEVPEILGFVEGTATVDDLGSLARVRRARFQEYLEEDAPDDRFETSGAVHVGNRFTSPADLGADTAAMQGDEFTGLGCCPGVVTGRVRVIRDPRGASLESGEILVAERTDPGWILLFPSASAILVQRGSLLSHSAIVAREMGIPAVVSIPGLLTRLNTGDVVEMDGSTGRVRILERAEG